MPRVMVIDDDSTMVSLLTMLLELEGFDVSKAPRHDSILEGIRAERPDVVLMDVFLAGADGMEVLSQLRASPDLASAVVVMTSGMDLEDRCLAAGANAFLLKPYTPEQLISKLKNSLAGDGPSAPSARLERKTS
ncbi:MAG: response regulator [Chloroflexota bacterium]